MCYMFSPAETIIFQDLVSCLEYRGSAWGVPCSPLPSKFCPMLPAPQVIFIATPQINFSCSLNHLCRLPAPCNFCLFAPWIHRTSALHLISATGIRSKSLGIHCVDRTYRYIPSARIYRLAAASRRLPHGEKKLRLTAACIRHTKNPKDYATRLDTISKILCSLLPKLLFCSLLPGLLEAMLPEHFDPFSPLPKPSCRAPISQELLVPQKWFTYQNLQNFTRKIAGRFSIKSYQG